MDDTCANCLIVSRICLSRTRRSVTTIPIEGHPPVGFQCDQSMREPRDGIALARTCRMLDQVTSARADGLGVRQQLPYRIELMEPWEDLFPRSFPISLVRLDDDLGIVFEDVGQVRPGQDFLPQIVGLKAAGVRRVARAAVPTPVEGKEPRVFARKWVYIRTS